ncbi:MAG: acyltransferase [Alphaproteobacteria bacterium]|nr:acyltransferase [Alphaproteobacteria bacterium]
MIEIKGRIVFLDYLRIFAFLSVLIGHEFSGNIAALSGDQSLHITLRCLADILTPFYIGGAAGVVVFFLISGYIITHVLRTEKPVEFLIKRAFRIYPLFIVAILLEEFLGFIVNGAPLSPFSIFIPRLLLIGDFFGTPLALAGVEWTLRVEILFYLFMAGMKAIGLFRKSDWLPLLLLVISMTLYALPKVPNSLHWNYGYFNLYTPFLFMGTCIYLAETKMAKKTTCIVSVAVMFLFFLHLISEIQPLWKETHYAVLALILFLSLLSIKNTIKDFTAVRFLSSITYSVYLFHKFLWDYLLLIINKINFSLMPINFQVLSSLLLFCYLAHRTIERYGIKLGQRMASYYREWIRSSYGQSSQDHFLVCQDKPGASNG